MAQQYSVFLSYRHKPLDAAVTQKTFNILEAYRLPASLRDEGYTGVTRVFRDTEELPVSRVLTNTIQTALSNSEYLVVVCSPDTPSSEWVDREVATFIEMGKAQRIYPLLIAGSPETSFPPSLKKIPDVDRRVMDARSGPLSLSAAAPGPLLAVIAAVAGCPRKRLVRADKMRRSAKGVLGAALSVGVAAALVIIAAVYWQQADNYRAEASRQQRLSMDVLSKMTYELPNKLVELPSTYAQVAQILKENAEQINGILELAREQDGIREQMSANYEKYATASTRLGKYDDAIESQKLAIGVYEELAGEKAQGAQAGLASTHNNMGVILNSAGRYDQAAAEYLSAVELLRPISQGEPGLSADLAVFLSNSGANAMDAGDYAAAASAFAESNGLLTSLSAVGDYSALLARGHYNLGVCQSSTGAYVEAEEQLAAAAEIYRGFYQADPKRTNLKPYAQAQTQLALCLSREAKLDEAMELFPQAIELLETLAAGGDDAAASSLLGSAYNNYGLCLNMSGDYAAAAPWYMKYALLSQELYAAGGTDLQRAAVARAYYNVAENAFKLGDLGLCRSAYDRCLAEYEPVHEALGAYHSSEYLARLCYYDIIIAHDYPAALKAADDAMELAPDSAFVQTNRVYALMYCGKYADCDAYALKCFGDSPGDVLNIELDFAALRAAGLENEHMDTLLELLRS